MKDNKNMMNNTVADNNTNNKEDNTMMNIAMAVEELKNMKRDELRVVAQTVGIKGYSRMKKDDLVQALTSFCKPELKVEVVEVETTAPVVPPVGVGYTINPLDDPEVQALDVSDNALMAPTTEIKKEVVTMNNDLMKEVAKEIMAQTLAKDKNGKWVLQKYALFYKATKTDVTDYMVVGKRLWGVVSKVIGAVEGEDKKTSDRIKEVIDQMESLGMITKVAADRTYAVLNPDDMSQDEKDQLNNLWRTNDIKTEKVEGGKVKATAVTANGKEVLNQLYPTYSYRATADQMNAMFRLSR
jgi:hypothetical protein